ncbi:MAG: DNA gyrase modulator, partial [Candidatus Thermoplasmatota archaeon]|nr:DNA gyrase modulator [Candidatus Thermoplasmatota archaeon]
MVIQSQSAPDHGRPTKYLDRTRMNNALEQAMDFGATYAEIRLMAETTSSVRLKDGQLEHAIPGQEIGATLRILADGAWGVHSTTDISNIPNEIESTVKLARAVAARRPSGSKPIQLAEIPVLQDEIHWRPKKDVRNTDLQTKLDMLQSIHASANDDDRIISVACGWSDEHLHTELLTTEGMDRTWSFQRSMVNGMVTARDGGDPVSYRMRHGGEGGLE